MYEVDDMVFYGVIGVCKIFKIGKPPVDDIEGDFYYLSPVYDSRGVIYSPVKGNQVLMRKVITRQECEKLYLRAANCKKDELLNEPISPAHYDEVIKSQDPLKLMQLIRCLYNIKNDRAKELRRMKSADSRIHSTAKKLLYGELAAITEKTVAEVTEEYDAMLGVM